MSKMPTTRTVLRWPASHTALVFVLHPMVVIPALMLLSSCASGTSRDLETTAPCRSDLVCALPESLNGPLDTNLPLHRPLVRLAADDRGQVGIAWIRDFQLELEPGDLVGMAIVSPSGIVGSGFLEGIGSDSVFGFNESSLGTIAYADGKWRVPMTLWPSKEQIHPSTHGIAIAEFDSLGWKEPVMRVAGRSIPERLWLFVEDRATHLFWFDFYIRDGDLLDLLGGSFQASLFRLDHAVLKPGRPVKVRTLYNRNARRHTAWESGQVLRLGPNRYDLFVRRVKALTRKQYYERTGPLSPDDLLHLPNILGKHRRAERRIARLDVSSTYAAFSVGSEHLGIVWLEQIGTPRNRLARLREAHMINNSWSQPREVARGKSWKDESLAVATFPFRNHDAVLAIWQNRDSHLVYTVSTSPDCWSEPVTTNFVIGDHNWLTYSDGQFVLATKLGSELYWCYFGVKSPDLGERLDTR